MGENAEIFSCFLRFFVKMAAKTISVSGFHLLYRSGCCRNRLSEVIFVQSATTTTTTTTTSTATNFRFFENELFLFYTFRVRSHHNRITKRSHYSYVFVVDRVDDCDVAAQSHQHNTISRYRQKTPDRCPDEPETTQELVPDAVGRQNGHLHIGNQEKDAHRFKCVYHALVHD